MAGKAIIWFVVGLAVAFGALGAVWAATSGDSEVRINVRRLDNGSVEVGLQQRDESGWADRQLPQARFLPAAAETDMWRVSSPLQVTSAAVEQGPQFCIVAHGAPNDYFWRLVRGYSRQAAIDAGMNVRFSLLPDGADQAAAIERCSNDGAAVIAATLADPDAVRGALLAANEAGARIITFNSGAEHAESVGSRLHIALDDAETGRLSGQEFNRRGTVGDIGCLLHESRNIGLNSRCDALADTSTGGETHRIDLPEGGDRDAIAQAITARLLDADQPRLTALLALNADTMLATLDAVIGLGDSLDYTVKVAAIGQSHALNSIDLAARQRHVAFIANHAGEAQGYLITAALRYLHTDRVPSAFVGTPTILTAAPSIFDTSTIQANPAEAADVVRRTQQRLRLGEEYDE